MGIRSLSLEHWAKMGHQCIIVYSCIYCNLRVIHPLACFLEVGGNKDVVRTYTQTPAHCPSRHMVFTCHTMKKAKLKKYILKCTLYSQKCLWKSDHHAHLCLLSITFQIYFPFHVILTYTTLVWSVTMDEVIHWWWISVLSIFQFSQECWNRFGHSVPVKRNSNVTAYNHIPLDNWAVVAAVLGKANIHIT